MDLAARKYKFLEQFMQIASEEKIERLEQFLKREILDDEIPDVVKQILDKSIEESNLGNVRTHEQVITDIKAKYNLT